MKNKIWIIYICGLIMFGCSLNKDEGNTELRFGEYYIGNRLIDDIIILKRDSTYIHIVKNDNGFFYRKKATWTSYDGKVSLNDYTSVFDDNTLELLDTLNNGGVIEYTIREGYLSIENEHLNYYHESTR